MQWTCRFLLLLCALSAPLPSLSTASKDTTKFLLYTVKSGEGFNLRRDVHMRVATLVRLLQDQRVGGTNHWVVVLPPWPNLYHWRSPGTTAYHNWTKFFDLPSLNQFVPTIEFDEFLRTNGRTIDEVIVLQNFEGEFTVDDFGNMEEAPCLNGQYKYKRVPGGGWEGSMFGTEGLAIRSHRCISAMGFTSLVLPLLRSMTGSSLMVENFEILLHEKFGDINYWQSRYSMVYSAHLRETGNTFMRKTLGYEPNEDSTGREPARGGGGEYIAVHLRRRDYLYAHKDVVPSLEGAASQLNMLKRELGLERVFLSSDAPLEEKQQLRKMVKGLVWYTPSNDEQRNYGDGGVAIIDQWVTAHARHFLGTTHSTFSFRIQEDRQFLGFSKESTFNDVCGPSDDEHNPHSCKKPSYWKWEPEGGPPTPIDLEPPENSDREEL